jgi:hypothetical protein
MILSLEIRNQSIKKKIRASYLTISLILMKTNDNYSLKNHKDYLAISKNENNFLLYINKKNFNNHGCYWFTYKQST